MFLLLPCSSDSKEMPANKASTTQALMTKALSLCCCVEMYQAWPNQSLVEAASHHLKDNLQISDLDGKCQFTPVSILISYAVLL